MCNSKPASSNAASNYNNLIVKGVGYLNRIREVESGKKGSIKYLSMTVNALRGDSGEKTRFEVRVTGEKAQSLTRDLLQKYPNLNEKEFSKRSKVFAGFSIGDIQPTAFTVKQDGKDKTIYCIDGRLLRFAFINVDGEEFYKAPAPRENTSDTPDDANAESKTDEQPTAKAA